MAILKSDLEEIIEFLDNLGDGQDDQLGKECKRHSKTIRKLIDLVF